MIEAGYLHVDDGLASIGAKAEREWGGRNYIELLSVFDTPDLFTVVYGNRDLGSVHELSFRRRDGEPAVLLLGGRAWRVQSVNYDRHVAYVEPSDVSGRSTWLGSSAGLSLEICQAMRSVLLDNAVLDGWSRRARESIAKARAEADVDARATVLRASSNGGTEWWTWAGLRGNATLSSRLTAAGLDCTFDSTLIRIRNSAAEVMHSVELSGESFVEACAGSMTPPKFSGCVPDSLLRVFVQHRLYDSEAARRIVTMPRTLRVTTPR